MINGLGRRIIGDERARQNKLRHKQPVNGLGRRILGAKKQSADEVATAAANPFLAAGDSLSELRAKLDAEPQLLQLAIDAENQRDRPRKAALAIFARVRSRQVPTDQKPTPPAAGLTVTQVGTALEANPAAVGELLAAEIGRAEGVRRPVMLQLREAEEQRPAELGGPRTELLALIDEALADTAPADG